MEEEPEDTEKYLQQLDHKLTLSKMSSESREGGIKIGKRYLKMFNTLYPQSGLRDSMLSWIDNNLCYGNSSIVHGWITAYLEVEAEFRYSRIFM